MKRTLTTTLFIVVILLTGCDRDPYGGVKPDMGPALHKTGRPAIWHATYALVGNSGFEVAAGPSRYQDKKDRNWDYYSILITKKRGRLWHLFHEGIWESSSYVFFQRDFRMEAIPNDLINKKVKNIAKYDNKTNVVTFEIGTKQYTYTLPNR